MDASTPMTAASWEGRLRLRGARGSPARKRSEILTHTCPAAKLSFLRKTPPQPQGQGASPASRILACRCGQRVEQAGPLSSGQKAVRDRPGRFLMRSPVQPSSCLSRAPASRPPPPSALPARPPAHSSLGPQAENRPTHGQYVQEAIGTERSCRTGFGAREPLRLRYIVMGCMCIFLGRRHGKGRGPLPSPPLCAEGTLRPVKSRALPGLAQQFGMGATGPSRGESSSGVQGSQGLSEGRDSTPLPMASTPWPPPPKKAQPPTC